MNKINVIGIDLATKSFQVHGNDKNGKCVVSKAFNRDKLMGFLKLQEPCLVAMEACGSAHYWANFARQLGHDARIISPQHVIPFVLGNKNDKNDSKGIADCAARDGTQFVAIKSVTQIALQQIHRTRESQVRDRLAVCNRIRGFLLEYGIVIDKTLAQTKKMVTGILHDNAHPDLPYEFRATLEALERKLKFEEDEITLSDKRIAEVAKKDPICKLLQTIPGVGVITATAIVASVPDPKQFKNGRQFAAWLGLVPSHTGTGGAKNNRNGAITKKGDRYLRSLIVHGSRSVLRVIDNRDDAGANWVKGVKARRGWNKACVALANKNARIIWAVLNTESTFDRRKMAAAV